MEAKEDIDRLITKAQKIGLVLTVNAAQTKYEFSKPGGRTFYPVLTFDEALLFIRACDFFSRTD